MKYIKALEVIESKIDYFLDAEERFQENDLDVWLEGTSRALLRKLMGEVINNSAIFAKMFVLRDELAGLLSEFSTPNWDENGAESISDESWDTALGYLAAAARIPGFPDVTIDTRGKVCLQWGTVYSKYLLVKFGASGCCTCFFKRDASERTIVNKTDSKSEGNSFLCSIQYQ